MNIIVSAVIFSMSFALSRMGMYAASGILLMAAAVIFASYYCIKDGRRINPPAVFSISWMGGIGISCLKLSYLETDWETLTWISLFAAYAAFITGYKLAVNANSKIFEKTKNKSSLKSDAVPDSCDGSDYPASAVSQHIICRQKKASGEFYTYNEAHRRALYIMMNAIAVISLISLIAEVYILGYIPLFTTDTPHAYSYFHVSGLHYFTISCCLLPALGTLCLWEELMHEDFSPEEIKTEFESGVGKFDSKAGKCVRNLSAAQNQKAEKSEECPAIIKKVTGLNAGKKADIFICMSMGVLIPILLVSRYQLFFGILLAGYCILILNRMRFSIKLNIRSVLAAGVVCFILVMLYVFITIERAHSVEYLNGIFEMKNERLPIFVSQPYIYIANNFDNFNCLVKELPEHTKGLRMCFPFIALTGLKFLKPELAAFPIYITKEELTTVTLIYDSYYDFGLIGVIVFCLIVGAAAAFTEGAVFGSTAASCTASSDADSAAKTDIGCAAKTDIGCAVKTDIGCATKTDADHEKGTAHNDMTAKNLQKESKSSVQTGEKNPFYILLYAEALIYMSLAFFTTWLSNPTTWFLFGVTVIGLLLARIIDR